MYATAFAGMSEYFSVDTTGDSEVRECASLDLRVVRPGGNGAGSIAGPANKRPCRGY